MISTTFGLMATLTSMLTTCEAWNRSASFSQSKQDTGLPGSDTFFNHKSLSSPVLDGSSYHLQGPVSNSFTIASAVTFIIGYVGCKVLSQKYSCTGIPQVALK